MRAGIAGIIMNVLLAAFKAAAGIASHSVSILLDAVNNLTDSLSSLITVYGMHLASKKADEHHPLGHGRIEYISALIVAGIVLYAGVASAAESIKALIHPKLPDYTSLSLVILVVSIAVKLIYSAVIIKKGRANDSVALTASGTDARNDAILSGSVLLSALIFMKTGLSLEAWVGLAISAFIIQSAIELLRETMNDLIGHRIDPEISAAVREVVDAHKPVYGTFDLVLSAYGPEKIVGSLHIEVPENMTAAQIYPLTRHIAKEVYQKTGVLLSGISVYPHASDPYTIEAEHRIRGMVCSVPGVLSMHGFYIDKHEKHMIFDVVLRFDAPKGTVDALRAKVHARYPDYRLTIISDLDISD